MYSIGDTVLYGVHGVCKIDDIAEKEIGNETINYFVLKPVYDTRSTFFVPASREMAEKKLRRLISCEEINALLTDIPDQLPQWIVNDNERKEKFKKIVSSCDCKSLIIMIRVIINHKDVQQKKGRKLHISDEVFLNEAQKIVNDEFASVLGIGRDDVVSYIQDKIGAI